MGLFRSLFSVHCSRLLILLVILCSFLFIPAPHANAQFQNPNYLNTNPDVPQNFHTYTQSVFIEIASAIFCQVVGTDPINPSSKCLGVDPKTQKIGFVENGGGLFAVTGHLIASTFQIPVSSTHYGKYLADNFGIAKKTQAAAPSGGGAAGGLIPTGGSSGQNQPAAFNGTGFTGLSPIIELWKLFRNLIYLFFVFIFVIIGLGIMFRVKIDPRTVMTIQNQIPKIIIALVLVTFSYAIVGFLIDMMYVFLYLIFNIFSSYTQAQGIDIDNFNPRTIQGSNPITAVGLLGGLGIAADAAKGVGGIIASLFDGTYGTIISSVLSGIIGGGAGGLIGSVPGAVIGGVVGLVGGAFFGSKILGILGGLIAFIVIAVALLSALFRLWFQLLKAYIFILINTVLAPFWIAGGLVPGASSVGFGPWMRDMIANLSAFPVTLLLFLLGKVFIESFGQGSSTNFVPPFIGNPGNSSNFAAIIGLGIILLTPQVVNIVRQTLKAPESKFTTAIGASLGVGAAVAGAGPSQAWRTLMRQPRWAGDQGGPLYSRILTFAPNNPIMRVVRGFMGIYGSGR